MQQCLANASAWRALSWFTLPRGSSSSSSWGLKTDVLQLATQPPQAFIDAIWSPLRDSKPHIREAAVQALKVGEKVLP
jgi:hypothetical protein